MENFRGSLSPRFDDTESPRADRSEDGIIDGSDREGMAPEIETAQDDRRHAWAEALMVQTAGERRAHHVGCEVEAGPALFPAPRRLL